ncbi:MAG: ABC transporter substrate-binding protein [Alphaproteobacteria bacterium]|nr:MAG: ABC transporter substrate-binding protein [Alphaproteobacteria bacterium]
MVKTIARTSKAMDEKILRAKRFALGLLLGLALIASAVFPVRAEEAPSELEAMGFIQSLADDALGTLSEGPHTPAELQIRFRSLLADSFQMEYIGLLVLGRYRTSATPEEIEDYLYYFEEFILQKYSSLLSDYAGESFTVVSARPSGDKDMIVTAEIDSQGTTYATDWRVRNFDGDPKVIDIKVEGISMVQSQREEFAAILQKGGMTKLVGTLKSAVGETVASN